MPNTPPDRNDVVGIDLSGPPNETLFWDDNPVPVKDLQTMWANLDPMWRHYRHLDDDRLVARVAALCIETAIDRLLRSIAPGFNRKEFRWAPKLNIAKSLQLLPKRILTACDHIGEIRNRFAHEVECKRFEDLKPQHLQSLESDVREFITHLKYDPRQAPQQLFKEVVGCVLVGLEFYAVKIARLRAYVSSDAVQTAFGQWCVDRTPEPAGGDESPG
jgi:hypothetical protein